MSKLAAFFMEDTKYKLLALLIAVALWAYVGSDKNPKEEAIYNPTVEAVNIPSGYNLNLSKNQLSVIISASHGTLMKISPEDVKLWVDLKGIQKSTLENGKELKVKYSVENVNPKKIKVVLNPSTINVRISKMNNIYLPVNIMYSAPPPIGYMYKNKMLSDNTVFVTGPQNEINLVARVSGSIPSVDENGFSGDIKLSAYSKDGTVLKNVTINPTTVNVSVQLEKEISRKYVLLEPDITGIPAPGYSVDKVKLIPEKVLLEGPLLMLNGISILKTDSISVEGADKTIKKKVDYVIPSGMKEVDKAVPEVTVVIEKRN